MAEDLYSLWLGLPAGPRPPDHYALLGVPRFCDDLPLIETATRRQLRELDKHAIQPDRTRRAACSAMMNEVAMARVCLANAHRKRAYDESLGRQLPASQSPSLAPAATALPVEDTARLPQPSLPPTPTTPAADPQEEFQQEVRRHLHQWVLNDHEMRLLLATAESMGIDADVAQRIIRRIDAEADEAARQASSRWNYILVGGAVAALVIVLAVVFAPAWLRLLGDASRSSPQKQRIPPRPRPDKTAATALETRITQALAGQQYAEVPELVDQLRALGTAANAERMVSERANQLRTELNSRLAEDQWNAAAKLAKDLSTLNPKDQVARLEYSALAADDGARARRDIAAALELSPTDPGALSAAKAIHRRFAQPIDANLPATEPTTQAAPSTLPLANRPSRLLTIDLGHGVSMELALIPAGRLMMGSPGTEIGRNADEGPQREVAISRPFYLGVCEVTQEQYELVMAQNPSASKAARNPVEMVSWDDAVEFCRKLSLKAGRTVFLPTEAQWECACRAGGKARFGYGGNDADLGEYAWYSANAGSRTHPVGGKRPNAFGLYDMHGNVWEWCSDWYSSSYVHDGNTDPGGMESGTAHVLRGGSWGHAATFCRSAYRFAGSPVTKQPFIGFRVAAGLPSGAPPVLLARQPEPASQPTASQSAAEDVGVVSPSPATAPAMPFLLPARIADPKDAARLQRRAAERLGVPMERLLALGNGVTIKIVLVPPGRFVMGSPKDEKGRGGNEGPQREVTISRPFYMGVYEVTQAQYERVMGKNPSQFKGKDNPVENVSWNDGASFCQKVSRITGEHVRIPTEAQWEYACRAGSKGRFSFGDNDASFHIYGSYCDKSNTNGHSWQDKGHDDGFDKTAPVGSFKPNAFGLCDMHGNVWEWCSDWYVDSYANANRRDPQGPASGTTHVMRGGSWYHATPTCRSAMRLPVAKERADDFGFRVLVELTPRGSAACPASQPEPASQPAASQPAAEVGLDSPSPATAPAMPLLLPARIADEKDAARVQRLAAERIGVPMERLLALGNGVTMKLVLVPPGRFAMGSPKDEKGRYGNEGPLREVTISRPFYMGVYEVTQAQYEQVMGKNPSQFKGKDKPVENVSWNDGASFCQTVSRITGEHVHLPTEAQWEHASRAWSTARFCFGDDDDYLQRYGNYCDKSNTNGFPWQDKGHKDNSDKTAPVGSFKPNAFGLCDMHGNVWEWCSDWYADSYANASRLDPQGPASGTLHVMRGGSWYDGSKICRSALRTTGWGTPANRTGDRGFRIVVELTAGGAAAHSTTRPVPDSPLPDTQPALPDAPSPRASPTTQPATAPRGLFVRTLPAAWTDRIALCPFCALTLDEQGRGAEVPAANGPKAESYETSVEQRRQ